MKNGWNGNDLPELDNYSNAGGVISCAVAHPFNAGRRKDCQDAQNKLAGDTAQSDLLMAQAVLAKAQQAPEEGLSPMAITGIVVASLMAITVMVVVIKKTKTARANRG